MQRHRAAQKAAGEFPTGAIGRGCLKVNLAGFSRGVVVGQFDKRAARAP